MLRNLIRFSKIETQTPRCFLSTLWENKQARLWLLIGKRHRTGKAMKCEGGVRGRPCYRLSVCGFGPFFHYVSPLFVITWSLSIFNELIKSPFVYKQVNREGSKTDREGDREREWEREGKRAERGIELPFKCFYSWVADINLWMLTKPATARRADSALIKQTMTNNCNVANDADDADADVDVSTPDNLLMRATGSVARQEAKR